MIRLLISLALVAALVWVALTVPLGSKTLWQHVKAIAGTEESQQLVKGVRERAKEALAGKRPAREVRVDDEDDLTPQEREVLRKLIRKKLAEEPAPEQPEKQQQ
jgi:hypothetical protein